MDGATLNWRRRRKGKGSASSLFAVQPWMFRMYAGAGVWALGPVWGVCFHEYRVLRKGVAAQRATRLWIKSFFGNWFFGD